ncbi:ankyrin repeat-containing domain protein, partial [Pelagophyceae sp. CCMP2097]
MQHVHGWPTAWYGGETAVSLNAQDWTGRTALMHAAARGYERVVIAMCDRLNQTLTDRTDSLDANVGEYATARTALHLAALCAVERVHTIRALCIHAAADVSATDYRGQTALHLAAARKNVAIIRELLDHNADVGVRDKNGNTALHTASRAGATGAVVVLVQQGAVVDAANAWGDTSLHIA